MDLQGEALAGGGMSDSGNTSINGNGGRLQLRGLLPKSYKMYLAFMAILAPWIAQLRPSAFRSFSIRTITFLVSLCVNFAGILLRSVMPLTQLTAKFFNGALLFTGILSPFALFSVFFPDWLCLLLLPLILIISIVVTAPNSVLFACNWIYEKVKLVIGKMIDKLRAWRMSTGQNSEQGDSAV